MPRSVTYSPDRGFSVYRGGRVRKNLLLNARFGAVAVNAKNLAWANSRVVASGLTGIPSSSADSQVTRTPTEQPALPGDPFGLSVAQTPSSPSVSRQEYGSGLTADPTLWQRLGDAVFADDKDLPGTTSKRWLADFPTAVLASLAGMGGLGLTAQKHSADEEEKLDRRGKLLGVRDR